ncbi:MAG: response regulator transcription factor [Myxococcales bacterium]|nr:response regulator transcription factor [Myxococcales bacterium]
MLASPVAVALPIVRVAVVSEDPLARAGLGALVAEPDGVEVVAQGGALADVLQRGDLAVDVLLVDGEVSTGAGAPSAGGEAAVGVTVVPVVAMVRDTGEARSALSHGARGVVRREASARVLRAAVRAVSDGLVAIDPALGEPWTHEPERAPASARSDALTPREAEVLQLLAEGLANKEIAARLGISDHTVKFHVNALMAKLGVQSRTEAVVRAARMGWLLL